MPQLFPIPLENWPTEKEFPAFPPQLCFVIYPPPQNREKGSRIPRTPRYHKQKKQGIGNQKNIPGIYRIPGALTNPLVLLTCNLY